jgi:UV DNA damage endonuclease
MHKYSNHLHTIVNGCLSGIVMIAGCFAPHPKMQFDWKEMCSGRLRQIGEEYSSLGFRFSMHPGQYNVLNSLRAEVARHAIAELNYSCDVLDLMGLDSSHKVIVHGGGVYADKEGSLERPAAVLTAYPITSEDDLPWKIMRETTRLEIS